MNERRLRLNIVWNVVLLLVASAAGPVLAGSSRIGTSAATFLKLGIGARPAAMGEAWVAADNDVNMTYWNPAGLATLDRIQASFMYYDLFEGITYNNLSFAVPLKDRQTVGFTVGLLDFGSTPKTIEAPGGGFGGTIGTFKAKDQELKLSYAYLFQFERWRLPVGLNLKYIYEKIDEASASGLAGDIGLQFQLNEWEDFRVGFMLQNMGQLSSFEVEKDPLPFNVKLGVRYAMFDDRLNLTSDINAPRDNSVFLNAGAEYFFLDRSSDINFALRGGFTTGSSNSDRKAFTVGAGFNYRGLDVDYAFLPFDVLDNTHRISISYRFGPERGDQMERLKARLALKKAKQRKKKVVKKTSQQGTTAPTYLFEPVEFTLQDRGFQTVSVVGDFNDWDPGKNPLTLDEDRVWRTRINLKNGKRYLYKFTVNDVYWIEDPKNTEKEDDGLGGYHSVLDLGQRKGPIREEVFVEEEPEQEIVPEPKKVSEPTPEKTPQTVDDYLVSGYQNIEAGNYKEALRDVIEVMKRDPMNEQALSLSIRLRKVIRIFYPN